MLHWSVTATNSQTHYIILSWSYSCHQKISDMTCTDEPLRCYPLGRGDPILRVSMNGFEKWQLKARRFHLKIHLLSMFKANHSLPLPSLRLPLTGNRSQKKNKQEQNIAWLQTSKWTPLTHFLQWARMHSVHRVLAASPLISQISPEDPCLSLLLSVHTSLLMPG